MKSPFGMTIEATIEYNVSSKLYLKFQIHYQFHFENCKFEKNVENLIVIYRQKLTFPLQSMGSTCCSNKGNISSHSRVRRISEQSLGRISLVGIRILYQINNIDPNLYILETY